MPADLTEVNDLRAAILAAVSHDLRTPLASVKAAVSSLRQHDVEWTAGETEEFLATIEEETDRLSSLVGNLLDASRIQTGASGWCARKVGSRRSGSEGAREPARRWPGHRGGRARDPAAGRRRRGLAGTRDREHRGERSYPRLDR